MSTITYERTATQQKIDEAVLERVKRGIAFLEEKHGPDWVDYLDLSTLDLSDGDCCILGQIYADQAEIDDCPNGYWWSRENFLFDDPDGASHGFSIFDSEVGDSTPAWAMLQKTWEYVLTPLVEKH